MPPKTQLTIWQWLLLTLFFRLCWARELQVIDANAFEERAMAPAIFVVAFCMPWFEPCKTLKVELSHAAESLGKTSDVDIYEFDCSEDESFCTSMGVLSFPTIRIFDHREWTRYRGRQKASSIVTHVLKQVLDATVKLDQIQFGVMKSLDLPLMVLTRSERDETSSDLIDSLAQRELSSHFFIGELSIDSPFLAETSSGRKPPFITVFNAQDETIPVYDGPFERDSLLEFANSVSTPLITQLQLDNIVGFMQSGLPLAMLFSTDDAERKTLARGLTNMAMRYRGRVNFVTVDAEKHSFTLAPLGLNAGDLPAFVIQTSDNVFKFNQDLSLHFIDAIEEFVQQSLRSLDPLKVQGNSVA